MSSVKEDCVTASAMKLIDYFAKKLGPDETFEDEDSEAADDIDDPEVPSKFTDAVAILKSNPYHEESITEVESIEDVLKIMNFYEVKDSLQ